MPDSLQLPPPRLAPEVDGAFPVTHWTLVLDGSSDQPGEPLKNLLHLATAYWKPLYVFARQRGADHDDAADMVQGFFEELLSREVLGSVKKRETRFRTFLLTCFTHWVSTHRRRESAGKRGGMEEFITLEELEQLEQEVEDNDQESPERTFDRRWARALYDNAIRALDQQIAGSEDPEFLTALMDATMKSSGGRTDFDDLGRRFSQTPASIRKAAHELRQKFSLHLRHEVRKVVASKEEVDEELRYLISLLIRQS